MWYFFRVELHGLDDYDSLHKAMAKQGFCRDIPVVGRGLQELPTGMYRFKEPVNQLAALAINLEQLSLGVQTAARSVHHDFEYVGFASTEAIVFNLKSSTPARRDFVPLTLGALSGIGRSR